MPNTRAAPDVAVVFPEAHQRGGVERIAWDLMHHLLRTGRRVAFVGRAVEPGADPALEQVLVVGRGNYGFRRAAAQSLRDLKPRDTISLGANCPPGDLCMVQSVHRAWLRSARTVPVAGRQMPAAFRYALPRHQSLLALEALYFRSRRPREFLCCSAREASDLGALYGVAADRLAVVPNGFDPAVFQPQPAEVRQRVRAAAGLPEQARVLLLMANELHRKGFAQLLAAAAALDDPSVHVAVVGRADLSPYAGEIARLGLEQRVRWHGSTGEAAAWYAAADLLVLPTQYEPFGLVIVEALACGLPVLTTRLAGASVAIKPGFNGLLQDDAYSVPELTALLRKALAPGTLAGWAAASPTSVEDFRADRVFAQVERRLRG